MNRYHTIFISLFLIAATLACSINVDTGLTPATQSPAQPSVAAPPTQPPAQPSVAAPPTKLPNNQTTQPPTTQPSTTSDFRPCSGYNAINPDGKPQTGYGPWASRLMTALSTDGITFTRTNKVLSDQADVPDIITMPDGEVRVYFVIMCPEEVRNKIVVAVSKDNGTTWVYKKIKLNGVERVLQPSQVDPTVEFTTDNKIRLYFTSGPGNTGAGKPESPRSYSAISSDGYNFTLEEGVRFTVEGKEVLDPNVILIGNTWHFFSGGIPGSNYHATSTDGLNFKRTDDLSSGNFLMANGLKVDGGYRYYGFVQKAGTTTYITALFSTDGVTWKPETWKFEVDTKSTLESVEVKDVSVTRLSNGQYLMVYATIIPGYPTPQQQKPPQPGTPRP